MGGVVEVGSPVVVQAPCSVSTRLLPPVPQGQAHL